MDLSLDIANLATRGRRPEPCVAEYVRDLRAGDFVLLATNRSVQPIDIKRVSERHHALARLLASGVSPGEAGAILGYTGARVSILKQSPAFQELLELYTDTKEREFADVAAHMAGLSKDALIEMQDRLEETPESFTLKDLRETATMALDRTGHGPTSSQVTLNIAADMGDRLERARARARSAAMGDIIDVTPSPAE